MKRNIRSFTALLLLLTLFLCGCGQKSPAQESSENTETAAADVQEVRDAFDRFTDDLFAEIISTDALTLHYELADPSLYDIVLESIDLGLVPDERLAAVRDKYQAVTDELERLEHTHLAPSPALNELLASVGTAPVTTGSSLADLIRRPQISYEALAAFDPDRPALPLPVTRQVEIRLRYDGYIRRQLKQVEEFQKMESRPLPQNLDYDAIGGLRLEAREKLKRIRPLNFGQASRISGVSPADIAVLMIALSQPGKETT